jgi:hypothetical protein
MRPLYFVILLFFLTACKQKQDKTEFANTDLKYSSYLWHINPDSDKWEFYLANYMHIDSSGHFKLIRHESFMDSAKYFSGTLDRQTREIIDSVLLNNNYILTTMPDTPLLIYDGFTYLLDYKLKGKNRAKVQYINSSSRSPENILFLTSLLDREVSYRHLTQIERFNIDDYIDTLIKVSSYNLPPPPIKIKFIPPKTK